MPRHLVTVWNPAYAVDAMDAHVAVLADRARRHREGDLTPEEEVRVERPYAPGVLVSSNSIPPSIPAIALYRAAPGATAMKVMTPTSLDPPPDVSAGAAMPGGRHDSSKMRAAPLATGASPLRP